MKATAYPHPHRAPDAVCLADVAPRIAPTTSAAVAPNFVPPASPERPTPKGTVRKYKIHAAPKLSNRDVGDVVLSVCVVCACSTDDFYSRYRTPPIIAARQIVTKLFRENSNLAYPEIARVTGRPTHSTTITQYQSLARKIGLPRGHKDRAVKLRSGVVLDIVDLLEQATDMLGLKPATQSEAA